MKVYTKTGDKGTTALFGGSRVPKYHIRIESYGTVDELNSYLGLIRDQEINTVYKEQLIHIQDKLFTLGAILATDPEKAILKNGKAKAIRFSTLEAICKALDCQPGDILEYKE